MVEDLVRVGEPFGGVDHAREHEQRHPVEGGVGDDVDGVGETGADGGDEHGGRTRPLPDRLGHEAAGGLVLDQHIADARLLERVHEGQHLAARNAEGVAHTLLGEAAGETVGGTVAHGGQGSLRSKGQCALETAERRMGRGEP